MLTAAELSRKRRLKVARRKHLAMAHRRAKWQSDKGPIIRVVKPEPEPVKPAPTATPQKQTIWGRMKTLFHRKPGHDEMQTMR